MPITSAPTPPSVKKAVAPKPVSRETSNLTRERTEALAGLGQLAQVPLMALRQYADVGALGVHWPNVSREVAKLAESQEQVARVIDPLIKVGPYTGLITAVLPLVMQIAVNHGRVAPGAMGTVPATSLAAQVETAMAQAELEALRTQMEAERQSRKMRDDIDRERREFQEAVSGE